jgi:uncharacterized iron-regulated membrane protein
MARAGAFRLRGLWRGLHLWIGLSLFLVLAPLGLSGSLLVWGDGLDRLAHPARYAVTAGALAPSAYIDAARRAFGGRAVPAQLRMPTGPGLPVTVSGFAAAPARPGQRPPSLTAWIDPASGRVIDVADPRRELRGAIHNLHGNLMLPGLGRTLVGWLGVVMLVSCLTGLILWWPRNNAVSRALRWTRSPSGLSNLHHSVGFWICVPLAPLSLSGASIAFPQAMQAITRPLAPAPSARPAGGGERPGFGPPLPTPRTGPDQALAAALRADGVAAGARLVSLSPPTATGRPAWRIRLAVAGRGPISVSVDDARGRAVARPGPASDTPGGDPIARFMRRLHEGEGYGPACRLIITIAGLAPTILGLTGVALWLRRRKAAALRR